MKLSHALILISAAAMTQAYLAAPRNGFARIMRGGGNSVSGSSSFSPATATSAASSSSLHMSTQSSSSSPIPAMIQSEIDSSKVVVFSKSYCPYCLATKKLFKDLGVNKDVKVIELDKRSDGDAIQSELLKMTGQRTVPNTFINGQHLGGNDKAQAAAKSGDLQKKLGL
jgi:glutaredoxin 3